MSMLNGDATSPQANIINNDGFWPDIDLADFIKQRQLPTTLTNDFLIDALLASVAEINADLSRLKQHYIAQGYQSADKIPGAKTHQQNALCAQYKKALYARAKADLIGEYTSIVSRAPNQQHESPELRSRLLAEASFVLRNMKGLSRVTVRMV